MFDCELGRHPGSAGDAESCSKFGILCQPKHSFGHSLNIPLIDQEPRFAVDNDVGDTRMSRRYDG